MPISNRIIRRAAAITGLGLLIVMSSLYGLWQQRPPLESLPWPIADRQNTDEDEGTVVATWLGVTTLLIDDGETQILIDGYFSRPGLLELASLRKLGSDVATINYVMDEYRIDRLAAIVPVHSHFDHAMDVGHVANRSTALVIGSESTANIARGADVPVNQFQTLADGESRVFGKFSVTLLESRHVPIAHAESGWPAGVIEEPLRQPARFWAWKGGIAYSILIEHPEGTALIQGSAGFVRGKLESVDADVVFLSVAGLAAQGAHYTRDYWREVVQATGAVEVYPIHLDDFTLPFGQVALLPPVADDIVTAAGWIDEHATRENIAVRRPPFGVPFALF